MPTPALSILVPTYNGARFLPFLCASIQRQTCGDFEALLWDDGSTDNTAEVVAPFLRDERFRLQRAPKNQGLHRSWRELLSLARGEFWCSPGGDDLLFPDFLERRVTKLRADPDAALVHGPAVAIDENGKELQNVGVPVPPELVQAGSDALLALLEHNYVNQPSVLARTEATRRVLPLWQNDWKYAPDWHLWILHAASGQTFLYDAVPAHQYRIHQRSLTHTREYEAIRRAEDRLVPLVACRSGAQLSAAAGETWRQWRRALHALWLRRAWVLRHELRPLDPWVRIGRQAFQEKKGAGTASLQRELLRHVPEIVWFSLKESAARRNLGFQPVGLAQVRHAMFR